MSNQVTSVGLDRDRLASGETDAFPLVGDCENLPVICMILEGLTEGILVLSQETETPAPIAPVMVAFSSFSGVCETPTDS
ncbi:MAG TPA: hypothetical protein VN372_05550 [Methanospirillum sp.]|nr:hypothetical protein [Methanospirillum sp.]